MTLICDRRVPPEDVAAFALDGEPADGIDLAAHLPHCPACRSVLASLAPSRQVAELLRAGGDVPAPAAVTQRALSRVRAEARTLMLLRTFAGATARVARALPDYVIRGR